MIAHFSEKILLNWKQSVVLAYLMNTCHGTIKSDIVFYDELKKYYANMRCFLIVI